MQVEYVQLSVICNAFLLGFVIGICVLVFFELYVSVDVCLTSRIACAKLIESGFCDYLFRYIVVQHKHNVLNFPYTVFFG